jgi:hypothetical protein
MLTNSNYYSAIKKNSKTKSSTLEDKNGGPTRPRRVKRVKMVTRVRVGVRMRGSRSQISRKFCGNMILRLSD